MLLNHKVEDSKARGMGGSQIMEGLLCHVWDHDPLPYNKCRDTERLQTGIDIWRMNFKGLAWS